MCSRPKIRIQGPTRSFALNPHKQVDAHRDRSTTLSGSLANLWQATTVGESREPLVLVEDVPLAVELRWRPSGDWAASSLAGVTSVAVVSSSAARKAGRCRYPLTRRNCRRASPMAAAIQRSTICPSCQRLTLPACSRQIEIIDSIEFASDMAVDQDQQGWEGTGRTRGRLMRDYESGD
jgi:hypothetical protein